MLRAARSGNNPRSVGGDLWGWPLRRLRRSLLLLRVAAGLAVALFAAAAPAAAEPRVALVVGNSDYGGDLGHLPNPVNDAKLMAETLRKVGFAVVEVEDGDQSALKQAIVDFGDKLSGAGAGATGLFYYAGHGVQMGGENYLIPVHAKLRKPADLDVEAVPIGLVLKQMDFAQSAVNIVILDACRNNPLADSGRDVSRGLAEIKSKPVGSFISFSTAPGQVAEDGNGANSPYTQALAQAILIPGLDLADVFRHVRKSVLKATNQKQVPWDSWSLTDPYYFIPPSSQWATLSGPSAPLNPPEGGAPPQAVASLDPNQQIEMKFWDSIQNSNDPADFQAYLDRYPSGSYVPLAVNRLAALGGAKAQPEAERTVNTAPATNTALVFTAIDQLVYTKNDGALYEAPDANAALITKVPSNVAVRAAGRSPDGLWWQLHLPNGRVAYAKASDIDERPDAAPPPAVADAAPDQNAATQETPAIDATAQKYFDLGEALFGQDDLKGARDAYDKAVARDAKFAKAVLRRGQAALAMGDLDPALADLEQAIVLDPKDLEAHNDGILARLEAGDIAGAAKASDAVQEVEPTIFSVNVIAAYYLADRLDDAAAMAARVTQDNPTYAAGWIWQSMVMRAQGRDGEAFDLLQTGIDAVGNRDWPVPVIEWMQGKRTADRLKLAAKSGADPKAVLRQLAEADFYLGAASYADGDRAAAEKLLGQATEAKAPDLLAFAAAKAMLAKMARE
jgi:tetratricopeptide (TPR) repeat protein